MAVPLAVTHSSLAPALLLAWDAAAMAGSLSSVLFTLPCSFLLLSSYSFIIIFLLLFAVLLFIYLFYCSCCTPASPSGMPPPCSSYFGVLRVSGAPLLALAGAKILLSAARLPTPNGLIWDALH